MPVPVLYALNILVYAAFPFYFALNRDWLRTTSFYVYIGIVLTLAGFLGGVYSFPLAAGVNVSGGNVAYGALMMATTLLVVIERKADAIRNVIRLILTVNAFKFVVFELIAVCLKAGGVKNPFATQAAVFDVSLWFVIVGAALIVAELILILLAFEFFKTRVKNAMALAFLCISWFVAMLCLDGVLFPVLAFGLRKDLVAVVIGGVGGKLVMAASYGAAMLLFMIVFRKSLVGYVAEPIDFRKVFLVSKGRLVREIEKRDESLKLSEGKFLSLADSIDDVFFSVDRDRRIVFWNKASERMGFTADEALGKHMYDLFPWMRGSRLETFILDVRASGKAESFIHRVPFGGDQRWLEISVYPSGDGMSVLARDITDRMNAENLVKSSLRQKEVLLQELYHRTKNNMQVICSLLSLEAAEQSDARLKAAFRETENRIQSMALVHQMLYDAGDLSSIDLGKYVADLVPIIAASYDVTSPNVVVSLDLESVPVRIDTAIPCGLIVNELVSNAFKHAFPAGRRGRLDVRLRASDGDLVELLVADDGIGGPTGFDPRTMGHLGTKTVVAIVERQLGGTVAFDLSRGFACALRFRNAEPGNAEAVNPSPEERLPEQPVPAAP